MRLAAVLLLLAGEPVQFDAALQPHFTVNQIANSEAATRVGLARWASTPHGRQMIDELGSEVHVNVIEDLSEAGIGRAPQPGIATFLATSDRSKTKTFDVVLNPAYFRVPRGMTPLPHQPSTPADMMALAWAGEMLHVSFYAQGVSLPHHNRADFQSQWREVAAELGMPMLTHDDDDDRFRVTRRILVMGGPR